MQHHPSPKPSGYIEHARPSENENIQDTIYKSNPVQCYATNAPVTEQRVSLGVLIYNVYAELSQRQSILISES